jgi:glycosyltransferase involved in cell wall biosynthesis
MKIEFVIPTYNRTDHLMTIISSIVAQTNPNWRIHVVVDGPTDEIKIKVNNISVYYQDLLDKIKFTFLEERFNDWGHTPRNYGLSQATEEWVIMTGEDNYYVPTFVENFLSVVRDDVNFVFCNMVHNWVKDEYIPMQCQIEFGKIDVGNFMSRTYNSQKLRLRTDVPEADWLFIDEYLNRFTEGKIIKIDKVLYVHN